MKDKISRINEEWAPSIMKCLEKSSHRDQRSFQKKVQQVLTQTYNEEQLNIILGQCEEFLQHFELKFLDPTMSSSEKDRRIEQTRKIPLYPQAIILVLNHIPYLVSRINESTSVSLTVSDALQNEESSKQVQQYYLVIILINEMVKNQKHPFLYMIGTFQQWALLQLKDLQNGNQTQQKQKICKFALSTSNFINLLIAALNEYLGDLNVVDENPFLKNKQKYFNYFLSQVSIQLNQVINETLTIHLIEAIKGIYKHHINIMKTKISHLIQLPDFFEIPKKYLVTTNPFQQQIQCLMEIQFFKHPAEKFYCLQKTAQYIKDQLSRSASNYFLLQTTNYVVVHSQIPHLQAEVHLVELFYPNSPVIHRFQQSLDFIQNIIIS